MSIRNIVKVMNFHALIRVDNAKRKADKYRMMEEQLYRMMDVIMNNRNLILDKKVMEPNPNAPEIQIYIGSDFGFCSNYNSQMNERLNRAGADAEKILIGRKLISHEDQKIAIRTTAGDLERNLPEIRQFLETRIRERSCSKISIIYNHYENTTTIYAKNLTVYPVTRREESDQKTDGTQKNNSLDYTGDFAVEGDINQLMMQLISSYLNNELLLALVNSRAAENILRQNATTDSLKKIDEMEEERVMEERREIRGKEFQKVVDNYVKKKMY